MGNNSEVNKSKRGVFLWIMLANAILVSFSRLLTLLFPTLFSNVYAGWPTWGYAFNIFLFIVEVAAITGVILWRKWGVYLMVIIVLTGISKDFMSLSSQQSITDILLTIPILVLFMWAVKRKWPSFN